MFSRAQSDRFCKTGCGGYYEKMVQNVPAFLSAVPFTVHARAGNGAGETLRVGLKYGSDAMSAANLQNYRPSAATRWGILTADGSFEELGALPQLYEKITVTTDTTYSCAAFRHVLRLRRRVAHSGAVQRRLRCLRGWRVLCARWQLHEPECGAVRAPNTAALPSAAAARA